MPIFVCKQLTPDSHQITITDPDECHHIRNVLRLAVDAAVDIINGEGLMGHGVIQKIDAKSIVVDVDGIHRPPQLSPRLILACAIPKKGKFETIIEKCTELGVDEIIPLQTRNSDVILKGERAHRKRHRFEDVAQNATKQSRRATIPGIHLPMGFDDVLDHVLPRSTVLIPSLCGDREPLFKRLNNAPAVKHMSILIGPEGDFSRDEYAEAHRRGCVPVCLGPTILKVETAAITTVAVIRQFYAATNPTTKDA